LKEWEQGQRVLGVPTELGQQEQEGLGVWVQEERQEQAPEQIRIRGQKLNEKLVKPLNE